MNIRIIATNEEGYHATLFPQTSFPSSGPSVDWLTENGCEEIIPPAPTPYVPTIQDQISQLEWTITPRRTREAILGTDNGWLANVDAQIAALRAQL